jgi:methionyl-tRNA synthetase
MYIITTPIPYTNAAPHLGHLLEGLYTDTLSRYQKTRLGKDNVILTMGLDQHGLKIYQKAIENQQTPQEFVNITGKTFIDLWNEFNVEYTTFVPTSSKRHTLLAQSLFRSLVQKDLVYKKEYQGLYCVGCEDFYTPSQLTLDGNCPIHLTKPISMQENNYFFRLSNFEQDIIDFLDVTPIKPEGIKNEWYVFIRSGLQDISCTREKSRLPWGITVPNDDQQVMYVWIEALLNYCTAIFTLEELEEMSDTEILNHLRAAYPIDLMYCSKEISKFHLVVFPALLKALDIPLPRCCVVHGMINDSNGVKMSKTIGNTIYPSEVIAKFGLDATRFIFLHEIGIWGDSQFDWAKMVESYNAFLCNNFGNIFTRVTTLVDKYGYDMNSYNLEYDWTPYHTFFSEGDTKSAFDEIFKACTRGNEYLEQTKPWMMAKDEDKRLELDQVLGDMVNHLRDIAANLQPFMPDTSDILQEAMNLAIIKRIEPIFQRIEL